MKKNLLAASALVAATLALSTSVAQAEDKLPGKFSGTVGMTSDYVFRGVSQTNEDAAFQASIDWAHDSGVYAGIWGSNVNFGSGKNSKSNAGDLETDVYAGYKGKVDAFTYNLGGIYYVYPGASSNLDYDYFELTVGGAYDFGIASVSAAVNYSPDFFGTADDTAWYYTAGVSVPLGQYFSASANIGHQNLDTSKDYTDWNVGVAATYDSFTLGLKYVDTNLHNNTLANDRYVVSLSRAF
ncbi:MAG: TorF family putative porin [Alphaproteobacteria bacterium]